MKAFQEKRAQQLAGGADELGVGELNDAAEYIEEQIKERSQFIDKKPSIDQQLQQQQEYGGGHHQHHHHHQQQHGSKMYDSDSSHSSESSSDGDSSTQGNGYSHKLSMKTKKELLEESRAVQMTSKTIKFEELRALVYYMFENIVVMFYVTCFYVFMCLFFKYV